MLDNFEKHENAKCISWNGDQRQIRAWNTMRKHWVNF